MLADLCQSAVINVLIYVAQGFNWESPDTKAYKVIRTTMCDRCTVLVPLSSLFTVERACLTWGRACLTWARACLPGGWSMQDRQVSRLQLQDPSVGTLGKFDVVANL